MRYVFNKRRIWYVPNDSLKARFTRSLAEEPCPKDKWYSTTDLLAFSVSPLPDDQIGNLPTLLFGPWSHIQEPYDDPEVQGGKIALIAFKQKRVQKPPNFLDRMQSTFLKQVAYNQRIVEAENEISGINCDVADFVAGMTLDPADELVMCVTGSLEMKRNETAMAGQLWMQGDRMMTASITAYDGMSNSKEAAILPAVAEAVVWKNDALELDGPRKGQRVDIYPKELTQLDIVLSSGDPNADAESGHPIAYQEVLAAAQSYEHPPIFLREDSERITSDALMSSEVPKWMCMAERVATGSRRRVLENGPDTWHSDDEAIEDVLPDEEHDMHTSEMDPKKGPMKIPQTEAARQRAAANALKQLKSQPPRPQTPVGGSSDNDDPDGSDMIWSKSRQTFRKNKAKVLFDSEAGNSIVSSPQLSQITTILRVSSPEPTRQPTPLTSPVNSDDEGMSEDQRRQVERAKRMESRSVPRSGSAPDAKASSLRAKAAAQLALLAPELLPEAKAPLKLLKGQESPGTKVPPKPAPDPHPMATRRQRQASGAGCLRSGGGSGQTDTCVVLYNPSKT
jgi:hypothetical protein